MSLEQKIIRMLAETKRTLALAESCTGGLVSNRITDVPGASDCLDLCVVAYTNEAKMRLLGVKRSAIGRCGAVSEPVAVQMAQGARRIQNSTFGLSITGIAGPTGGNRQKPIGLAFIAIASEAEVLCLKCQFKGSRKKIKKDAGSQALKLLFEFLE